MKKVLIINYQVNNTSEGVPDNYDFLWGYAIGMSPRNRREAVLRGGTRVSNENLMNMIRLLWLQGHYGDCDLILWFNGQEYKFNEYAVIVPWPKGFMEVSSNIAVQILTLAIEKRKAKRGEINNTNKD